MKVIFEDDSLLLVDKPAGLVVDKSESQVGETLEDWLVSRSNTLEYHSKLERMGIVHRLDKDTSGVLLVAKTQEALDSLQSQFKERKVKKEYLALVHGLVDKSGRVEGAIGRNPISREKFMVGENGKEAVTEYEPVKLLVMSSEFIEKIFHNFNKIQLRKLQTTNYQLFTLVACRPLTGRTHQIRVHLKYISHPIVSDEKYAGRKMVRYDKRWCPRMFLHAKKIGFYHPVSGDWLELECDLPKDLQEVLDKLSE